MHHEILNKDQRELLPLVSKFSRKFGLVGGTAIALQIGHRQSIDFDLFTTKSFNNLSIRNVIKGHTINRIFKDEIGQYTLIISSVQFTFFQYPYEIKFAKNFEDIIKIPDLLTLAAMKLFALGRRAKWKDYVDIYFILKRYHGLKEIIEKANQIFGSEFNERIIREQLSYYADIDYSEEVIFMPGYEVEEETVKKELIDFSIA